MSQEHAEDNRSTGLLTEFVAAFAALGVPEPDARLAADGWSPQDRVQRRQVAQIYRHRMQPARSDQRGRRAAQAPHRIDQDPVAFDTKVHRGRIGKPGDVSDVADEPGGGAARREAALCVTPTGLAVYLATAVPRRQLRRWIAAIRPRKEPAA